MKTRFAPSPTGFMHLGNARTALFNALLAKSAGGAFVLRIEDTDAERSKTHFFEALCEDLHWLGLDWDEGPIKEGPHGPYNQKARHDIYEGYYAQLRDMGRLYTCFCSEQELAIARKMQLAAGQPPRYPGTCRHLTEAQIAAKRAEGKPECLRFRVPDDQTVRFTDLIFGPKVFQSADLGDFIIQKQDGGPTFMFANAIDDALMGITHALRGEDHLTNSPRQILILEALGLTPPQYGHFPIILGMDGKPLSKRNGSQSIQGLRESGYRPEAICNYMARLGHHYKETDWLDTKTLGSAFSLSNVGRAAAKFDPAQLDYWQQQTVRALPQAALTSWLGGPLTDMSEDAQDRFVAMIRENVRFPQEAHVWAQQLDNCTYDYDETAQSLLNQTPPEYWMTAIQVIESQGTDAKAVFDAIKSECGLKGKALFMPLRLVLTGQSHGPQMGDISAYLGATKMCAKIKAFQASQS